MNFKNFWNYITNPYTIINIWNYIINNIRLKQNQIKDINLPNSMQYAKTCNLPIAKNLDNLISENNDKILEEILVLIKKGYLGFTNSNIDNVQNEAFYENKGWKCIWIKFLDKYLPMSNYLPTLTKITKEIDTINNNISLLHVSIFWPPIEGVTDNLNNVILPIHCGISAGVYRYHYALMLPNVSVDEIGMEIDGTNFQWEQKTGYIWDDVLPHSSWNKTKYIRILIFADIPRILPFPYNYINKLINNLILKTEYINNIKNILTNN